MRATRTRRSGRGLAMLAGVVCLLAAASPAAASPAGATAARSPRTTLLAIEKRLDVAAQTAANSAPAGAAAALARATAPSLWLTGRMIVAPAYGATVFLNLSRAVSDLSHVSAGARRTIAGAADAVAAEAIREAGGLTGGLSVAAGRALAGARRQAARGAFAAAVRGDETAWLLAFTVLSQQVNDEITHVPAGALATAADNALGSKTIGLAGPRIMHRLAPLRRAGKPELFFGGAEGCPFCAVQRWGMVVALSQFGTFSRLGLMQSDPSDGPGVPTLTFRGSSYRSPWVSFLPVEMLSNVRHGHTYVRLAQPPTTERALLNRYDGPGQTPFIDIANRFIQVGSTVQPGLIGRLSWAGVAGAFGDPSAIPAQAVGGEAEVLTAELCEVTGGNPSAVCSAPVVQQYETALPLLNGRGGGCPIGPPAPADRRRTRRAGRIGRVGPPSARPARCII